MGDDNEDEIFMTLNICRSSVLVFLLWESGKQLLSLPERTGDRIISTEAAYCSIFRYFRHRYFDDRYI